MLLIITLFRAAEESIGRYLKTHPVFIDKLFLSISHSLYPAESPFDSVHISRPVASNLPHLVSAKGEQHLLGVG